MGNQKIYVVYNKSLIGKNWEVGVDNVAFTTIEKAENYIESKLTETEILKNRNAKKRNMQYEYEFLTDRNINYYWKVVTLE